MFEIMTQYTAEQLIQEASSKYPISVFWKGQIPEDIHSYLESKCNIHCSSVYMDGSAMYSIRYRANPQPSTLDSQLEKIKNL